MPERESTIVRSGTRIPRILAEKVTARYPGVPLPTLVRAGLWLLTAEDTDEIAVMLALWRGSQPATRADGSAP